MPPKELSDIYTNYEEDYLLLYETITSHLLTLRTTPSHTHETILRSLDRELEETDEILSQMELELYNLSPVVRTKCQVKLRQYRSQVDKRKQELQRLRLVGGSTVVDVNDDDSVESGSTADGRGRLMQGTERLQDSSRKLLASHRLALETEQSGINTLQELRRQREQMQHTRNMLTEADGYIDKAQRTLRGMARRVATNKVITGSIIVVLILMIVLIIYIKLR